MGDDKIYLPNMTSFGKSMTTMPCESGGSIARHLFTCSAVMDLNRPVFTDVFKRFCRTVCIDRTSYYRKAITKPGLKVVGTAYAPKPSLLAGTDRRCIVSRCTGIGEKEGWIGEVFRAASCQRDASRGLLRWPGAALS